MKLKVIQWVLEGAAEIRVFVTLEKKMLLVKSATWRTTYRTPTEF